MYNSTSVQKSGSAVASANARTASKSAYVGIIMANGFVSVMPKSDIDSDFNREISGR